MKILFNKILLILIVMSFIVGCSNQGGEGNIDVFRTGATREDVYREFRNYFERTINNGDFFVLSDEPFNEHKIWACFDDNNLLDLAIEFNDGMRTIIYQSKDKEFITEWQDNIEFNSGMTRWDIFYLFGFDYSVISGGNTPIFDDIYVRLGIMYILNDNSRLHFGFWVSDIDMTGELQRVYHQIDRYEFVRLF